VLHVSSMLALGLVVSGVFSVGLGLIHVMIPRLLDIPAAVGGDGPARVPLRRLGVAGRAYQVRRQDVIGISWVMSNAASYVLVSIGALDLGWATGSASPIRWLAAWIAGWWAIRAASQFAVGRRASDLAFVGWFAALSLLHLALGLGWVTG
jgi:hypothetical protein